MAIASHAFFFSLLIFYLFIILVYTFSLSAILSHHPTMYIFPPRLVLRPRGRPEETLADADAVTFFSEFYTVSILRYSEKKLCLFSNWKASRCWATEPKKLIRRTELRVSNFFILIILTINKYHFHSESQISSDSFSKNDSSAFNQI